jgi:hypothetical protein
MPWYLGRLNGIRTLPTEAKGDYARPVSRFRTMPTERYPRPSEGTRAAPRCEHTLPDPPNLLRGIRAIRG